MVFWTDRNLRLLFLSLFLWMVGVALYEGLVPIYARQLGASAVELGTLYTLRNLALAASFLIGWLVADRFSRRTLMLVSWFMGLPVPLLLAAAPSYLWLLPGLLLYELTFFAVPAIYAYITERVPPTQLASAFGVMGTVTSVAFVFSPTAGGIIAERWSIPAALWIALVLFLLSTVLIVRLEKSGPGTMPVAGSVRLTRADVAPVAPALLIYMGVTFMILVTVPFLPPYLREARGISLSEIGLLNSLQALGAVMFTPIAGRLGDRFGHAPTLTGQIGIWTAGILVTGYGPGALLAPSALLRCRSPLSTLAQAMVGGAAPPAALGRMFALAGMLSAVLSAVGSFIGGYAYRADPAYPLLISVATGAVLVIALLVRFKRR